MNKSHLKRSLWQLRVYNNQLKNATPNLWKWKAKTNFFKKSVNNFEGQLLICHKTMEVTTDDYAQLEEKYQEMLEFMTWRDEYDIMRHKYDGARGQMEQ